MSNSRHHDARVKAAHEALPPELPEAELERLLTRLRRARTMLACSQREPERERTKRAIHRLERELCIDVPGIGVPDKARSYKK